MNNEKVNAIITLLEDEASDVRQMMNSQLKQMSVEELSELCDKSREVNTEVSLHIRDICEEKENDFFVAELEQKVSNDDLDMEGMAIFLSRFIDHSVKEEEVKSLLKNLTERCEDYLQKHFDENRGAVLARFLGQVEQYIGDRKQYYAVGNSSIYHALTNKKALPITLSVLYIVLGKRLGINIQGVAVPAHFVVGVFEDDPVTYYNPFDAGKVMSVRDCQSLARRAGYPFTDDMLEPVDVRPIILRMLNNLQYVYTREKKASKSRAVSKLLKIWTERVFRQV